jgi:hypothetical protein
MCFCSTIALGSTAKGAICELGAAFSAGRQVFAVSAFYITQMCGTCLGYTPSPPRPARRREEGQRRRSSLEQAVAALIANEYGERARRR